MSEKLLPRLERYEDLPELQGCATIIGKLKAEKALADTHITEFYARHPEFYECEENLKLFEAWFYLHDDADVTFYNLEVCYKDLLADGLLKAAPPKEQAPAAVDRGIILTRTDALAHYVPSDDEAEQLAKLADSSDLNDTQRKNRLKKLKLLAGKQRREYATYHPEPNITI